MVTITAGTAPTGFTFKNWTSSNSGVDFDNANSETTTFTMPRAAVTVMAKFWFTDSRDGQKYGTVTIGGKMWMAENLNYDPAATVGSWCYKNQDSNCVKYGRLYNWNTAKIVCPTGWHLPDTAEWRRLVETAGGSSAAGKKLKATNGWYSGVGNGNGTDDFGFSALPGGKRSTYGDFQDAGIGGYWWTASDNDGSIIAYYRYMDYLGDYVSEHPEVKSYGLSVRCREDD